MVALVSRATALAGLLVEETRYSAYAKPPRCVPNDANDNHDGQVNPDDLSNFLSNNYIFQPTPGGVQPSSPTLESEPLGFNPPCSATGYAAQPYAADAYRVSSVTGIKP
jgi:hypothetical protein